MPNIVEVVVRARDESKAGFAEARASSDGLSGKLKMLGVAGGAALAGVAVASIKMASDFQSATTRLVTSAGETDRNIDMVRKGMLQMAGQVGMSAMDLAKGMYTVESAGFHGAQGLIVLKAAAQGAKDENADLAVVANAVTDVLTDYHLKAAASADVTSKLVTAVSFGKTNFEDFSKALTNVLPLAGSLHLKLADVSGVLAEMTAHGMSAEQASQNEANAIRELIAPTKVMQKEFALLGISTEDVNRHMSTVGLGGTLQWLRGVADKMAGSVGQTPVEAFKKLLGSASALTVGLMTTGENAKATNTAIAGISKASADGSGNVKGFAEIQKTFAFQLSRVKAQAESLAIQLGNKLMPAAQAVFGWMASHAGVVTKIAMGIGAIAAALALYAAAAKVAAVIQAVLNAELLTNPFTAIAVAVVALALLVIKYHTQIWTFIKTTWTTVKAFVTQTWDSIYKTGSKIWNTIYSDTIGWVIRLVGGIKSAITGGFDSWWKSHGQEVEQVWKAVWTAVSTIFKVQWDVTAGIAKAAWNLLTALFKTEFDVTVSVVKVAWAVIAGLFKTSFAVIKGIAKTAWDVIAAGVKITWAGIKAVLKSVWDVIVGLFSAFLAILTGHWSKAGQDLRNAATQVWNNIKGYLSSVWNAIAGLAVQIWNNVKGTITGIWNAISGAAVSFWNALRSGFRTVVSDLGRIWSGIENVFKVPVNFLIKTVYMGGIRRLWDDVMNHIGLSSLDLPSIPGLATGGKLPGFGGGDSVLAMLEPGEAVIDKNRTRQYAPLLKAMGVPGFESGGIVGDAIDVGKMVLAAATGNQVAFINAFKDFLPHGGGASGNLAAMIATAPVAMIKHIVSGLWAKITGAAAASSGGGGGSSSGGPGGGNEKANAALARKLYPEWASGATWNAWNAVAMAESGWNNLARNPNGGAFGIAQALGHGVPGGGGRYGNMYGGYGLNLAGDRNANNGQPNAQIVWMHNYIKSAWGSPQRAWANEQANHYYAPGGATSAGWAIVGEHGRELIKLPGGATVRPHGATEEMIRSLFLGHRGTGGGGGPVQLEISSAGQSAFEQFMIKAIREWVRVKGGGSVQRAFGFGSG